MTISTPHTRLDAGAGQRRRAGFTLTEVMVSAGLASMVLAGVLGAFLLIGRTGYASSNYSEMESQIRRALDVFGADARKATNIQWTDPRTITLAVVTTGNSTTLVTYAYDADPASAGFRSFYRVAGPVGSTAPRTNLVRQVASDFSFQRFKLEQPGVADNTAASDLETKQIQVNLRAERTGATTVTASQSAVSARYLLRNKRVSN